MSSCLIIYKEEIPKEKSIVKYNDVSTIMNIDNEIIGNLKIDKINLNNDIYNINSIHNNIEENVTILKENNNLIVLAAHSGEGSIAYFNDLDKLEVNDIINLTYYNNKRDYIVTNIEEQNKDGTIEINKTKEKRLILTTCSTKSKDKQLVITTKIIEGYN